MRPQSRNIAIATLVLGVLALIAGIIAVVSTPGNFVMWIIPVVAVLVSVRAVVSLVQLSKGATPRERA